MTKDKEEEEGEKEEESEEKKEEEKEMEKHGGWGRKQQSYNKEIFECYFNLLSVTVITAGPKAI